MQLVESITRQTTIQWPVQESFIFLIDHKIAIIQRINRFSRDFQRKIGKLNFQSSSLFTESRNYPNFSFFNLSFLALVTIIILKNCKFRRKKLSYFGNICRMDRLYSRPDNCRQDGDLSLRTERLIRRCLDKGRCIYICNKLCQQDIPNSPHILVYSSAVNLDNPINRSILLDRYVRDNYYSGHKAMDYTVLIPVEWSLKLSNYAFKIK